MAWFRKKPDPISDRARALNEEIARLGSQIQQLDARLQECDGTAVAEHVRCHAPVTEPRDLLRSTAKVLGDQIGNPVTRERLTTSVPEDFRALRRASISPLKQGGQSPRCFWPQRAHSVLPSLPVKANLARAKQM